MSTLALALTLAWTATAQTGEVGFREVKPQVFDRETRAVPDIWVLGFTFRNPRYIMVDVPGKGRKLIWYMTYRVVNHTGEPRKFIPQFTLVTDNGNIYHDVVLPRAEKSVIAREDPTQARALLNSITISAHEIPPTPEEGAPIVYHGVAFWEDVDMNAKSFNIYVTGLSNGYVRVQNEKTQQEDLLRKTLKLEFVKTGDIHNPHENEIRFVGDPEWVYR